MRDVSLAGSARIRVRVKILALVTSFLDVVGQNAGSTVYVAAPFWMRSMTRDSVSQRSRDRLSHRWWVAVKYAEISEKHVGQALSQSSQKRRHIESMMCVFLNGRWARFLGKSPRSASNLTIDWKREASWCRINATNVIRKAVDAREHQTCEYRFIDWWFFTRKAGMQLIPRLERRNDRASIIPKRI